MEQLHLWQGYRSIPKNKYLLVVSLVVLALSLLEIFDFVELPYEKLLSSATSSTSFLSLDIIPIMTSYGYASLFILMALESASLPIPSEIVLPFAGYLVYSGAMGFVPALVVSILALMVGALVDYYLGLKLGRPFLDRLIRWFRGDPKFAKTAEDWINSKGEWSVFIARFIPGLRSIISVPAGILEMKFRSFVLTTFLGSVGWSALLIYLGYSAGPLWKTALGSLSLILNQVLIFAVTGVSIFYIVYYFSSSGEVGSGAGNSIG